MSFYSNTVIAIVVVAFGFIINELSIFSKIIISRTELPKMTIVGVRFRGPYQNTGKEFENLEKTLIKNKIETLNIVGIYFDSPQDTPPNKLRTFVGAIIPEPNEETIKKIKSLDLEIVVINKDEVNGSINAFFPTSSHKLLESISHMIGPMKAYPAIHKYIANDPVLKEKMVYDPSKNIPCFEIYDRNNSQIQYIYPIGKEECLLDFKKE